MNPFDCFEFPGQIRAEFVGSRITCSPPPVDTDVDILVQVECTGKQFIDEMAAHGWVCSIAGYVPNDPQLKFHQNFVAFRKDEFNAICTVDPVYYDRFWLATQVAKYLNLMRKPDRITLFEAIVCERFNPPEPELIEPVEQDPFA